MYIENAYLSSLRHTSTQLYFSYNKLCTLAAALHAVYIRSVRLFEMKCLFITVIIRAYCALFSICWNKNKRRKLYHAPLSQIIRSGIANLRKQNAPLSLSQYVNEMLINITCTHDIIQKIEKYISPVFVATDLLQLQYLHNNTRGTRVISLPSYRL